VAEKLEKQGLAVARIHGNRSQAQRTQALAGFKEGTFRVLVATDIVARGIDVEALEHVVNFDVPAAPEDYIHRVGRTARAEATGDAYTFVTPDDEPAIRAIERAVGRRVERRKLAGFDYAAAATDEKLEIPLAERIAQIRARKAEERVRAKAKASEREVAQQRAQEDRQPAAELPKRKRRRRGGRNRRGGTDSAPQRAAS
jgi:ATP-dependent RNA helicase RhlE